MAHETWTCSGVVTGANPTTVTLDGQAGELQTDSLELPVGTGVVVAIYDKGVVADPTWESPSAAPVTPPVTAPTVTAPPVVTTPPPVVGPNTSVA